jgi:hypothetical protein
LTVGCLAHLDGVVLEVVVEPPVELVPVLEFSVLLVVPPVLLPVPEPVPLVEPELVVAVDPEDGLPEDGEPLLDEVLPVSPPLGVPELLEEDEESVPVDDVPVPEASEPPFSVAARDDPGSTRPVEEPSVEVEEAGVALEAVVDEPAPG